MATYILIIYENYIIPNLGEYILKMSSISVDNRKSGQSPIDFTKKARTFFYTKSYTNIGKLRTSHLIFDADLEKKFQPKKKTFSAEEKKNNNNNSAKLYSLS